MGERASAQEIRLHVYTLQRQRLISSLHLLAGGFDGVSTLGCTEGPSLARHHGGFRRSHLTSANLSDRNTAQGLSASPISKGCYINTRVIPGIAKAWGGSGRGGRQFENKNTLKFNTVLWGSASQAVLEEPSDIEVSNSPTSFPSFRGPKRFSSGSTQVI